VEQAITLLCIITYGVKCRTGIAAGSPVPIDLMQQLIEKLNLVDLSIAYGMSVFLFRLTETSFVDPLTAETRLVCSPQVVDWDYIAAANFGLAPCLSKLLQRIQLSSALRRLVGHYRM
jgi:acyl-CoA synthetase (AMP-forming)/AMP-acid ligase II